MAQFRWLLAEVIAWCAIRASLHHPAECLRTVSFSPFPPDLDLRRHDWYDWLLGPTAPGVFEAVGHARRRALAASDQLPTQPADHLAGGRLLVSTPYHHVWDGASEHTSGGFIDAQDGPPWDTWVSLLTPVPGEAPYQGSPERPRLLAWVPPAFLPTVDDAIEVNPVGTLRWASDEPGTFLDDLRRVRLA